MKPVFWGLVQSQIQNGKKVEDTSQLRCWEPTLIPHTSHLNISSVALGHFFYLLLTTQGEVYSFGTGTNGRLGLGSEFDVEIPTKIQFPSKIIFIAAGYSHACAIDEFGKCFIWGNWCGIKQFEYTAPKLIPFSKKITKVSCGQCFTALLDEESNLFLFGNNRFGKCGLSSKISSTIPIDNPHQIILTYATTFRDVALGADFCVAISSNGELISWGNNQYKQCGVEKKQVECPPTRLTQNEKFIQVSCSKGNAHCHAGAVSESNTVYLWGDNYKHKLGMETNQDCISTPTLLPSLTQISKLECGGIHTFFLTKDNSLYCCGCGSDGRLGFIEAKQYRYLFKEKIPRLLRQSNVITICSGYYNNIALFK